MGATIRQADLDPEGIWEIWESPPLERRPDRLGLVITLSIILVMPVTMLVSWLVLS